MKKLLIIFILLITFLCGTHFVFSQCFCPNNVPTDKESFMKLYSFYTRPGLFWKIAKEDNFIVGRVINVRENTQVAIFIFTEEGKPVQVQEKVNNDIFECIISWESEEWQEYQLKINGLLKTGDCNGF